MAQNSLKTEVGLSVVTDCINKGLLFPFFKGVGIWGQAPPQKFEILKF